jgi:hypothetical protein
MLRGSSTFIDTEGIHVVYAHSIYGFSLSETLNIVAEMKPNKKSFKITTVQKLDLWEELSDDDYDVYQLDGKFVMFRYKGHNGGMEDP